MSNNNQKEGKTSQKEVKVAFDVITSLKPFSQEASINIQEAIEQYCKLMEKLKIAASIPPKHPDQVIFTDEKTQINITFNDLIHIAKEQYCYQKNKGENLEY